MTTYCIHINPCYSLFSWFLKPLSAITKCQVNLVISFPLSFTNPYLSLQYMSALLLSLFFHINIAIEYDQHTLSTLTYPINTLYQSYPYRLTLEHEYNVLANVLSHPSRNPAAGSRSQGAGAGAGLARVCAASAPMVVGQDGIIDDTTLRCFMSRHVMSCHATYTTHHGTSHHVTSHHITSRPLILSV